MRWFPWMPRVSARRNDHFSLRARSYIPLEHAFRTVMATGRSSYTLFEAHEFRTHFITKERPRINESVTAKNRRSAWRILWQYRIHPQLSLARTLLRGA